VTGAGATTWIVLTALIAGKPAGIALATWVAERAGFARPTGLAWRDIPVLGVAAGIGFTVALFFTTAAFPPGPILDEAKLGALLSGSAGALAIALGRLLGIRKSNRV